MGAQTSKVARAGVVPHIHLSLDALGTLTAFRGGHWAPHYINVAKRCGIDQEISEKELKAAFKQSFKSMEDEFPNYGQDELNKSMQTRGDFGKHSKFLDLNHLKLPSEEFWWHMVTTKIFKSILGREEAIPSSLPIELYEHFSSSEAYELHQDAKPFFSELRQLREECDRCSPMGISVGVVTNSDTRTSKVLTSLGLSVNTDPAIDDLEADQDQIVKDWGLPSGMRDQLESLQPEANSKYDIDYVVTSVNAGCGKPDIRIFQQAQREAQSSIHTQGISDSLSDTLLKAHKKVTGEYLHIGDDFDKDYLGATKAGFTALHLVRNKSYIRPEARYNTIFDLRDALVPVKVLLEHWKSNGIGHSS